MTRKPKVTLLLLALISALTVSGAALAGLGSSPSHCLLFGC